jgi:enterochelin esterase-like enzyme
MHLSLVHGAVPVVVGVVALASLAAVVTRRQPGWLATVARQAGLSVAGLAVVAVALRQSGALVYRFPPSFYAWCGLAVFAALLARAGWRHGSARQRVVSIGAVVGTAALAATLINLHYEFYPTLASIFGPVSADEQPPARLDRLRAERPGAGHLSPRGAVVPVDPPATTSGFRHRSGFVYLPPAWFTKARSSLPAVLMVAGTPGLTSDWIRAGHADQTADRFAAAHDGLAPVLIFADQNGSDLGDTECVDGPRGQAETYLTVDVRRWAIDTLGVAADAAHWAVAGFSEGGTCALTLALRHPDLFGTFADFSGELAPNVRSGAGNAADLFGGSVEALQDHQPLALLARHCYPTMAGWFEVGESDAGPLAAARVLVPAAEDAGIDTRLVTRPGAHNFAFWSGAFEDALPWLAGRLGLVTTASPEAGASGRCRNSESVDRRGSAGR